MCLSIKRRDHDHDSVEAAPTRPPAEGGDMPQDVADGLLLDVRELSVDDVELINGTAFDRALERILASNDTCNFNSFNSSI
jgi:hypothetical protein